MERNSLSLAFSKDAFSIRLALDPQELFFPGCKFHLSLESVAKNLILQFVIIGPLSRGRVALSHY